MKAEACAGYSVVIPCFNEAASVGRVVETLLGLPAAAAPSEIIVVDDGSTDGSGGALGEPAGNGRVRVVRHERNLGYGASLKTGIARAKSEYVAIVDADGTYPAADMPRLLERAAAADMVVGARTGNNVRIPWFRRPAKWALGRLARSLSGRDIPDLNSGMRIMRRDAVARFIGMLPDRFSFTTTITLAMLTNGMTVEYVSINYHSRIGRSKIRPLADTLGFLQIVCRTVMWFNPLRVFIPLSVSLALLALVALFGSLWLFGRAWDVTFGVLMLSSALALAFGMLADLIDVRIRK